MAVKVTLPNVKQALVSSTGHVNKAWFDFFRLLFSRTGGDQDIIGDNEDDIAINTALIYVRRLQELEKRIIDLEKEINQLGC